MTSPHKILSESLTGTYRFKWRGLMKIGNCVQNWNWKFRMWAMPVNAKVTCSTTYMRPAVTRHWFIWHWKYWLTWGPDPPDYRDLWLIKASLAWRQF